MIENHRIERTAFDLLHGKVIASVIKLSHFMERDDIGMLQL